MTPRGCGGMDHRSTVVPKLTDCEIQQPPAGVLPAAVVQHRPATPVPPSDDGLDELQLPPQRLVLLVAAADLQLQNGVAVVHQPADLRHGRLGQRLHDGRQLGVKRLVARHRHRTALSGCSVSRPGGFGSRDQRPVPLHGELVCLETG